MSSALGVTRILSGVACVCLASAQQPQRQRHVAAAVCSATTPATIGNNNNGGVSHNKGINVGTDVGTIASTRRHPIGGGGRPLRPLRLCTTTTYAAALRRSVEGVSYEVHAVAGDGRCLFRSVAAAVGGRVGKTHIRLMAAMWST